MISDQKVPISDHPKSYLILFFSYVYVWEACFSDSNEIIPCSHSSAAKARFFSSPVLPTEL